MRKITSQHPREFSRARRLAAALGLAAALCTAVLWTLLSSASAAPSNVTKTFSTTGAEQTFAVPDGVTSLDVVAVGGRGGPGVVGAPGLFGAVLSARLAVTPGQILFVEVGGNGAVFSGGFNGGHQGGAGGYVGGGGGGATDIRTTTTEGSRLITAGGGGGGGGGFGTGAFGIPVPGGAGGQAGYFPTGEGRSGQEGGSSCGGAGGSGGLGAPADGFIFGGSASGASNGSGGGGGGGDRTGRGGGAGSGPGSNGTCYQDGGGGGGGAGSSAFALTANDRTIAPDTTGVPQLRITYKLGGGGDSKSGLKYGKLKLNKNKGTALLPVTVPGSGSLSIGGKGVVNKRPGLSGFARLAKAVDQAGTYTLTVKAKGKSKRKLFATGKVKVKAVVTFKPSSGDAVHDTRTIKLKRN